MPLTIRSPAFEHEQEIPTKHTCEGQDRSPPLLIEEVSADTKSLALILEDPDAPDPKAPRMIFVHWILYNLPPDIREIPEGADLEVLPSGVRTALNDFKHPGYRGPCPPVGRHRYYHRVYALDIELPYLGADATRREVDRAMAGHILEEAALLGTFEKQGG